MTFTRITVNARQMGSPMHSRPTYPSGDGRGYDGRWHGYG